MPKARMDARLAKRSLEGPEDACGDGGVIIRTEDYIFAALLDVLGHGVEAHQVALRAEAFLTDNAAQPPADLITDLHNHLKGSRGAVAALCRVDLTDREACYSGMGNINTRIYGPGAQKFLPQEGIIGYRISTPREKRFRLEPGGVLVMSSDGVKEHFDPADYPGLLSGSAEEISVNILDQLNKGTDDASCLVLRCEK